MRRQDMGGFYPALVTPFTTQDTIHGEMMQRLMRRCMAQGASGFLIGGSSGESALLTFEERVQCYEAAGALGQETKLIAGVSAIATKEAIANAKAAKAAGFHAMISTAPYFYKFSMTQIAGYFRALRQAVDLPLMLYNFPGNTGVELDLCHPDIAGILTDGTICGVKQTSLNLFQLERMRAMNPDLVLYGGYDEVYAGARALGADGAIGSTFNFTLPLFTRLEAALAAHRQEEAMGWQAAANQVMQALVSCSLFPAIKYVLSTQGLDVGCCRAPFPRLTAQLCAYLDQVLLACMPQTA